MKSIQPNPVNVASMLADALAAPGQMQAARGR